MTVWFRNADRNYGYTWDTSAQPPMRWHAAGDGPAQYLADTPDGAWAEFLRHEEITDPDDLAMITRRVWAIDVPDDVVAAAATPTLPTSVSRGGEDTYPACQQEAARLRAAGAHALIARSAAIDAVPGCRPGSQLDAADARDARVLVVFGPGDRMTGWMCHDTGTPDPALRPRIRPL